MARNYEKKVRGAGLSARPNHFEALTSPKVPAPPKSLKGRKAKSRSNTQGSPNTQSTQSTQSTQNIQSIQWLEILADNFLHRPHAGKILHKLAERYPLVFHCVGMSLASTDPINWPYLKKIKSLQRTFHPHWISDHLCWVSYDGEYFHDLLPIPKNEKCLEHLCERIEKIQDFLGEALVVENITEYLHYTSSSISDAEFIGELLSRTHCEFLLDVTNLYINTFNHSAPLSHPSHNDDHDNHDNNLNHAHGPYDPHLHLLHPHPLRSAFQWLCDLKECVPSSQIKQIHLAPYQKEKTYLLDTHEGKIQKGIWSLYKKTLDIFGPVPTCLEWDSAIPSMEELLPDIEKIQKMQSLAS